MSNKTSLVIVVLVWIFVATNYLVHTPFGPMNICMCHDCLSHLQYTETLLKQDRFPLLLGGIGNFDASHHPPLYYLINSFIAPDQLMKGNRMVHVNLVRAMSVVYGAIVLLLISWFLNLISKDPIRKLLVLLFIATTPKFVNVFTSYNNDTLTIVLSMLVLFIAYRLYMSWSNKLLILLFLVATCGLYTKVTIVIPILFVILLCFRNLLLMKLPTKNQMMVVIVLMLSLSLLLLWYNFRTGVERRPIINYPRFTISSPQINYVINSAFRVPLLQIPQEAWGDPWVHTTNDPWSNNGHPARKADNYYAYMWISSVIGSAIYTKPSISVVWFMLFVHLLVCLFTLREIFRREALKAEIIRLSIFLIFFSHLIHLVVLSFLYSGASLDYRYLCWTWLGWAILYVSALSKNPKLLSILMFVSILINIYVNVTVDGYLS